MDRQMQTVPKQLLEIPHVEHFWVMLPRALAYPLRGKGKWTLAAATTIIVGSAVLNFFFCIADLIPLGFSSFFAIYLYRSIAHAAGGEDDPPDWSDLGDFWNEILRPMAIMTLILLLAFGPMWGYIIWYIDANPGCLDPMSPTPGPDMRIVLALQVLAVVLSLMPMLRCSMFDGINGLGPLDNIQSVLQVPVAYITVCLLTMGTLCLLVYTPFAIQLVLEHPVDVNFASKIAVELLAVYLFQALSYALGLVYRCHSDKLKWFE